MAKVHGHQPIGVDRLLDENDTGLTIDTLTRAARAIGYKVTLQLKAAS